MAQLIVAFGVHTSMAPYRRAALATLRGPAMGAPLPGERASHPLHRSQHVALENFASMLSMMHATEAASELGDKPARCGDNTRLGESRSTAGCAGSSSNTSSAAPAITPAPSARPSGGRVDDAATAYIDQIAMRAELLEHLRIYQMARGFAARRSYDQEICNRSNARPEANE